MPIDRISHLVAQAPNENPSRRQSFYRTFVQFLCSNLGLVIIVVAYSIGGAFLFILLEQYIELQNCQEANLLENVSVSNISESMFNYVSISTDSNAVMYDQIESYLENFTSDIYERRSDFRYTGQDCETTSGWSFSSALLFAITVITSIGYGHITPVSWEGQITCICYALIGIPIFLLCLANISSILGDMFRFMYSTFLHFMCCCCRVYMRNRRRKQRRLKGTSYNDHFSMGYVGKESIDPNWPEAAQQHNGERLSDEEYDLDEDDENEMDDVWTRMESRVPILVVILIIIGYVCVGAFVFNRFEGWSMVISVYFCYITLSTIGFGDYVPGITSGSTDGLRFLANCLYIVVGLAVLAMCFDLIKESIVDKFEWIGQKFGVVQQEDDLVDNDFTRYANFQYSQQSSQEKINSPPPAYEEPVAEGGWFKDIKDKHEPLRDKISAASDKGIKNKHEPLREKTSVASDKVIKSKHEPLREKASTASDKQVKEKNEPLREKFSGSSDRYIKNKIEPLREKVSIASDKY
ncbi:unnamed protein product [Adineta ricciae]|uniref:Potassium channel domain-containing protein n=1 Tax=Adineta ricciae TaxID=249248 RepID=A0A814R3M5_ADIRI|nr:unnamed protein product [Adineta ricciae]CAF1128103.1 unnamed protein product [Adineta ricciae]